MQQAASQPSEGSVTALAGALPRSALNLIGWRLFRFIEAVRGLTAFALITLGVAVTKFNVAGRVVHPLIRQQIHRSGVRMLPMISFIGCALGMVIIGQTVFLLKQVGAQSYIGTVVVTVVVRELGPLVAALLVLTRVGTAIVIELGTSRALGEVEALESLGIDPIHYLVLPRVVGLALSIFSLTIYLIIIAVVSGYAFAFLQEVPLKPGEYFHQIADALVWEDFGLLALKTFGFGIIIATVTCFNGLAQPLRLEEVSNATTQAMVQSVVACVCLDAVLLVIYFLI